ncbi:Iridoid oxidase [Camellia lanceoleosa]|uniref:Iridoid oxidase n=1 Tax=Camellia lanceoleosa TaxID=1840588 RepID=A0ACC0HPF2_9ERIC|nr:Iridoid oxidase [Camellia lanceoleosa]
MEYNWYSLTWLSVSFLAALLLLISRIKAWKGGNKQRPPRPPGWLVVGNMFDLGSMPHQNLYKLRFKYGPVLWLELGLVNTMVVQSAKAAAELFKNYDQVFCDRKVTDALTSLGYNQGSLAVGNYGVYWRILRRLCSMELLVNKRMTGTAALRRKCIDNMTRWIEEDSAAARARGGSGEVEISHFLFLMAFNIVGNLMLSRDVLEPNSEQGREFFDAMNKIMVWAGTPNVADFLPFLRLLDPLRIKRNMVRDMGRAMNIADGFVKDRIRKKQSGTKNTNKDFLDAMLEYDGDGKEGPDKISEKNVTIIILEMFFAGSETTSSTIEWAMVELLRNPDSLRKVKEEIDRVVPNRKVEETDIDELVYLQEVVKETLRLHPAVPFLIPRNSMEDSDYMGYLIPKNTQVLVNAWAIGRTQSLGMTLVFQAREVSGKNIEYKGQHFELIPFGSGRRICVGFSLAHRVVHLALATLIQSLTGSSVALTLQGLRT